MCHVTAISYPECGFSWFFSFPSDNNGIFKLDKVLFLQRRLIFIINLNLSKKLVKRYIWSIALHGAANWRIGKVDQKCLGKF